jgi:aminoglycoside phosphotransferase (APT) family kinase protein
MVADSVAQLINHHFAVDPMSFTRMSFGHSSSAVYDVVLPERHVMLKVNGDATALEGTEKNLNILAELGLPVSNILHSDMSCSRFPVAYVILEKISGTDLRYELAMMTKLQMTILAEQLVALQHRVMTLPEGQGFGWVAIGQTAPFAAWADVVQRDLGRGGEALKRVGEDDLYQRMAALARALTSYFASVRPVCFLDDITTKNVIVQHGQLQGLVDFDVVCYGDPLFWLSLTQTAVVADIGLPGQFYVNELIRCWNVPANEQQVIQFYSLLHALDFVAFATSANDEQTCKRLLEWMKCQQLVSNVPLEVRKFRNP